MNVHKNARLRARVVESGLSGRSRKKDTQAQWWCARFVTNQLPGTVRRILLSNTFQKVAKWKSRSHRLPARAG